MLNGPFIPAPSLDFDDVDEILSNTMSSQSSAANSSQDSGIPSETGWYHYDHFKFSRFGVNI